MRFAAAFVLCSACGRIGFAPSGSDLTTDASDASPTATYSELVLASGPRVYLRLSDASGFVARDASGHGEDGHYVLESGASILYQVPGALSTDSDPAVQMDGTAAEASAQLASVGTTWSNDFTLELFVRPMSTPPNYDYSIFICENYLVNGFRFGWDMQNRLCMWTSEAGATGMLTTTQAVTRDAWNHIVLVRQGPTWSIYLDGTSTGAQAVDYNPTTTGAACGLGAFHGVDSHAAYDEVAIYDRALTAAEVAAHVAAR